MTGFLFGLAMVAGCSSASPLHQPLEASMLADRIPSSEYDPALTIYTRLAPAGTDVGEVLDRATESLLRFLGTLDPSVAEVRYAPGKWAVSEVLQHVRSYEQIMLERAQLIAGRDTPVLHTRAYSQESTVAGGAGKSIAQLRRELVEVRDRTRRTFESFTPVELRRVGRLDGNRTSVRMIALCIAGHQQHHLAVLRERYLSK